METNGGMVTDSTSTSSDETDPSLSISDSDDDVHAVTEEPRSAAIGPPEAVREGKVVLVTGGAGFIGSHVGSQLLARGDTVVVIDEVNDYYDPKIKESNIALLEAQAPPGRFAFYRGDCCDKELLERIWDEQNITHVVHLAARAGVRPSINDPFIYLHSNVEATMCLLAIAQRRNVAHFVYASSSSVYGGSKKDTFKETDIVDKPVSPYAATKASCELLAHTWHHLHGMDVAGLRFFTVYGPRGRPDMAPFKFLDRVFRGVALQQYGNGTSSRDYTYIDDIANGVVRTLDRPNGCQVYNIGCGNPVVLSKFISMVGDATGNTPIIEYLPDQPGDVPRTCADISKARRELGYVPTVSFKEGLERTAAWYKSFYMSGSRR